jgi:hypothetical protein
LLKGSPKGLAAINFSRKYIFKIVSFVITFTKGKGREEEEEEEKR